MSYGVTNQGFVKKTLAEIQAETEAAFRSSFGTSINLTPQSPLGQIKAILDERMMLLWELSEAVYHSQYPSSASGINLDNVAAITGIKRKAATKSTVSSGRARGVLTTVVPAGTIISVYGDSVSRFVTDVAGTISNAAVDEIQTISYGSIPDAGTMKLIFDGQTTAAINYNDSNSTIESKLEALPNLTSVTVAGSFAAGHTVTFDGADGGTNQALLVATDISLTIASVPVAVSIVETVQGDEPTSDLISLTAESAGSVEAPTSSLTVIETPVVDLDSFINETSADVGADQETDADLKIRRTDALSDPGTATLEAIRSEVLSITEVDACVAFENDTDATDVEGRPAHSIDIIVQGGSDADIAEAIFDTAAAGITQFGSESEVVTDSQGFEHVIKFSRPVEVDLWVVFDLTVDSDYPATGDDQVKDAIVAYGLGLEIGQDVVVFGYQALIGVLDEIPGILDAVVRVDGAALPTLVDKTFTASDDVGEMLLAITAHGMVANNRIRVSNSGGALPTGLLADTDYWVVSAPTANAVKVSALHGGSVVAYTDAGTGTHTAEIGGSDNNVLIGERALAIFEAAHATVNS